VQNIVASGAIDLSLTINSWSTCYPTAAVPNANRTYLLRGRKPEADNYFKIIVERPAKGRYTQGYPGELGVSGEIGGEFTDDKELKRQWLYNEGKPVKTKSGGWMKIMIKMIIMALVLMSITVLAADIVYEDMDLQNYPDMFISNDRLDLSFVVGEFAQSDDVLATVDIASSLQENLKDILTSRDENDTLFDVDVIGDSEDELIELYMDVFNKKKVSAASTLLDTSLDIEGLKDQNLIVVGGPCVNWVAAHFKGNPENCAEDYQAGRGYLELFRNGKGIVMVVAGYSAEDTRTAAKILSHYIDYPSNFVGERLRVPSAWITNVKVE